MTKRKFLLGTLAAGLTMALAAPVQAQSTPKGDGGTIRMLINPAGTMSIPPMVIKQYGLDKKHGINVETVPYSNANAASIALQSKATEVVILDWLASARLKASGVNIVGVAPFMTYVNSIVVPKDSPAKTIGDLKGMKVGAPDKTGFDWVMTVAAAKKQYNLDLNKAVTLHEGAVPLLRGLMDQGELQATDMWNSLAPEMLVSGKYRTLTTIRALSDSMGLPTVPFLFFGMREEYAKANPGNTRAFVAAYLDAVKIMKTDDKLWEEQGKRMKLSPEATDLFKKQVRTDLLTAFTPDMAKGLSDTLDAMVEVAGPKAIGLEKLPANLITLDYQ
jgi:NitT/TauT family transport system substrate-binding protein